MGIDGLDFREGMMGEPLGGEGIQLWHVGAIGHTARSARSALSRHVTRMLPENHMAIILSAEIHPRPKASGFACVTAMTMTCNISKVRLSVCLLRRDSFGKTPSLILHILYYVVVVPNAEAHVP
jgi:hypothetical protein